MRVLIASAELSPLARTGGLGEAVAGLARALQRADVEVTVVMPRYQHLADLGEPETAPAPAEALFRHDVDGLSVLLVDDPPAFDRPGIYGPVPGSGYDDQWERFGRFSNVVRSLGAAYDLVHLNDSHTAPAALRSPVPTVLTIHNASYAIYGPLDGAGALIGATLEDVALGGPLEWYGQAHYLKLGIDKAHRVTTVSPTFAEQLADDPSISGGLDTVIRSRSDGVIGILNGIDTVSWDPKTDPALPKPFNRGRLGGRVAAKGELLVASGLAEDGMLFGNVGRMTDQKGIGLLDRYLDDLVADGFRLVLVGNGELDPLIAEWMTRHPTAVWHAPYSEELARLVSAGADAYLMPSKFEPCGLGQMYAMRYGAPPVVRLTGGLADTVIDLDEHPDHATGFGFRSFTPESLTKTIRRAMRVYHKARSDWRRLQRNGMGTDFSWDRAAGRYVDVYRSVLAE